MKPNPLLPPRKPGRPRKPPHIASPACITRDLLDRLAAEFPPETIAGKIHDLLEATHVTAGGKHIADNRAREAGLKLLMAYQIGLPIQWQEVVTATFDSLEDLRRRAQSSPAMQAALARIVESEQKLAADASINQAETGDSSLPDEG